MIILIIWFKNFLVPIILYGNFDITNTEFSAQVVLLLVLNLLFFVPNQENYEFSENFFWYYLFGKKGLDYNGHHYEKYWWPMISTFFEVRELNKIISNNCLLRKYYIHVEINYFNLFTK
ncbi:hypothetical protein BpHYR1_045816 [Brachionus plicatilis]|uniref:Uncharacterized protein n=1 Tax=Brachionus plicatilis TaxID=10195 RepID=A0A3M7SZ45_BRAPC|nr:hypothetical protein BpHYR1_045816 [Brachionus plicatilis]